MRVVVTFLLLAAFGASAATWYVRPGQHATYGAGNGTSYADAWNGITNITWTSIQPGDTLYACGTHIYTITGGGQYYNNGIGQIKTNNITIRGDYGPDPLVMFGGALDTANTFYWFGPDGNGVYYTTNEIQTSARELRYQVDGSIIQFLPVKGTTTWTGGAGGYFDGVTNYIRTISGNAPSNNIALMRGGWMWDLNGSSSNTFNGGTYIAECWQQNGSGWWATTNTMFLNLTVQHQGFSLSHGMDYAVFGNCDISAGPSCIYDFQTFGVQVGTFGTIITNCTLHDVRWYYGISSTDLHAIGCQAGNGWTIKWNHIYNTDGASIDLYSGGADMTNDLIACNFIHDIGGYNPNNGEAICVNSGGPGIGRQTGLVIQNNLIYNVGINASYGWAGIGVNTADPVAIQNNTILYCGVGIAVHGQTHPNQANVQNNIICSPTNTFIIIDGTGTTTGTTDYNLCYTNSTISAPFAFTPSVTHDTHSVFAYPLLVSASPTIATDFQLRAESPAIGAGTPVGISTDFGGNAFLNPPAIGAWEKTGVPSRTMYIGTLNLPH